MEATELKTTDYYLVNDLVDRNSYLCEKWERNMAKAAMISALRWGMKQDILNKKRIRKMKDRGLVVETRPLEL